MGKASDRLDEKRRRLYNAGEYEELLGCMAGSRNDARLFIELAQEDDALYLWWSKFQLKMWDTIFKSPDLEKFISERAKADGLDNMIVFQKQLHETGFATVEDICRAYGCTPEDIERVVTENPGLFKGCAIRVDIQ